MSVHLQINTGLLKGKLDQAVSRGVKLAAEHLRGQAVELTPIGETGNLRANALVAAVGSHQAAVYYTIIYAARQHEETTWRHPRGGQAKYLEAAAKNEADTIGMVLGAAIKGMM